VANTLTAVLPVCYEALDEVSRELVGFIPAVARDSGAERAAVGQSVKYHVVPAITAEDATPGTNPADSGDQTIGSEEMTISKSRVAPIRWTGEEQTGLKNGDKPQLRNIMRDQFAQAFRTLANEVESDLASAGYKGASRATGTAGTAPFGTAADLTDASNLFKILDDNGAPRAGRKLVLGTTAMANMRGKQSILFKVNEAGTDQMLRRGIVGQLMGFDVHDSAQVKAHTKGTGASFLLNDASSEAGDITIAVDGGTGTILAGDIVTFAGTSHKYVVKTALAGGVLVLNRPGLVSAETDDDAITVGNSYTANLAFTKNALHLVTRTPAMPDGGDSADDVTNIVDPVSGLVFQLAVYRQYRRVKYELGLAWGVKAAKSEHIAILLG
jgi:hypothetical protein